MARELDGFHAAVSVIFNGEEILEAGEEFFFKITTPEALSETKTGVNGPYQVLHVNPTATIEINLFPNSKANDTFWDVYRNQQGGLSGTNSVTLIDETGTTYECSRVALESAAEVTAGATDADERNWTFGVAIFNPPQD